MRAGGAHDSDPDHCGPFSDYTGQTPTLRSPHYITDNLLFPWGKKALTFSRNAIHLMRTPINTGTFYDPLSVRINRV